MSILVINMDTFFIYRAFALYQEVIIHDIGNADVP